MRGFTLIELVIVIALGAIVASFMAMFIAGPVQAYDRQSRRAVLTDSADNALRSLGREIRRALPNSVRITSSGGVTALEMLESVGAARYRDSGALGDPARELNFSTPDDAFATLGKFAGITRPFSSSNSYLAIYNVGVTGADAYEGANVITAAGTTVSISDGAAGEDRVTLNPAQRFAYGSPGKRVYLVSGPVTFLCDPNSATLRRYEGYSIAAAQTQRDSDAELRAAGAVVSTLAQNVASCAMSYAPGIAARAGLVSLELRVANQGEGVRLLHQVHVENVP